VSLNLEPREGAGDDSSARPWRRIVPAAAAVLAGGVAWLLTHEFVTALEVATLIVALMRPDRT